MMKHFRCPHCDPHAPGVHCQSVSGLVSHIRRSHQKELERVPGAIEGRTDPKVDVYGMMGIPEELLEGEFENNEEETPKATTVSPSPVMPAHLALSLQSLVAAAPRLAAVAPSPVVPAPVVAPPLVLAPLPSFEWQSGNLAPSAVLPNIWAGMVNNDALGTAPPSFNQDFSPLTPMVSAGFPHVGLQVLQPPPVSDPAFAGIANPGLAAALAKVKAKMQNHAQGR